MATRRGKIVFGVAATVLGAVTFLCASAFLASKGAPKWLSGTVGALAFPVLPAVWHFVGERRRKARIAAMKMPPKHTLAATDRYMLRAFAVILVVIGPMVAIGRFGVVRAMWTHKAWFMPDPPKVSSDVLAYVPADAELVMTFKDDDKSTGAVAWGAKQALVAISGTLDDDPAKAVEQLNSERAKVPFLKIDPISILSTNGGLLAASDGWRGKLSGGPSAELRAELARAPSSARFVIAATPKTTGDVMLFKSGVLWLVPGDKELVIDGRIEANDVAGGATLVDTIRALWKSKASEVPAKCKGEVEAIAALAKLDRKDAVVTLHLAIPVEKTMGLVLCGASPGSK